MKKVFILLWFVPSLVFATTNIHLLQQKIDSLRLKLENLNQYNQTLLMQNNQLAATKQNLITQQQVLLTDRHNLQIMLAQQAEQVAQLQQQLQANIQKDQQLQNTIAVLKDVRPPRITFSEILNRISNDAFSTQDLRMPASNLSLYAALEQIISYSGLQPWVVVLIMLFVVLVLGGIVILLQIIQQKKVVSQNREISHVTMLEKEEPIVTPASAAVMTDESIASKLDLGRAYIDMEHYAEAKQILTEVLTIGNTQQKAEAESLLIKIPKAEQ